MFLTSIHFVYSELKKKKTNKTEVIIYNNLVKILRICLKSVSHNIILLPKESIIDDKYINLFKLRVKLGLYGITNYFLLYHIVVLCSQNDSSL